MFSFGRGSQLVTFVLLLVSLLLTVHLSQALAIEKTDLSTPRSHQDIKRSNLDVFCKAFNKECFEKALAGQTGHVTVTHACQKQGGKSTKTFSFGCKRGKHDLTSKVLKAVVAQGYNVQTVGGTTTVTSRTGTTQVVYETKTLQIDATITSNAYQTIETTQSDVTGFTTATSLVTSTVATTTTTTQYSLETAAVGILAVELAQSEARRSIKVSNNKFCKAFETACSARCATVKSVPKHLLCESKSSSYLLTCLCSNGKHETQHALADAAKKRSKTVKAISTTTQVLTDTQLQTVTLTDYATRSYYTTALIPVTSTLTSQIQGTSTATSVIATATSTVISTTQKVLAATGYVHAIKVEGGKDMGALGPGTQTGLYVPNSSPIPFMAVYNSGYYQLQLTDGSGEVFISEAAQSDVDFESGSANYAQQYSGLPTLCGTAGAAPGPAAGSGNVYQEPCLTYAFQAVSDSSTASTETFALQGVWFNPAASTTSVYNTTFGVVPGNYHELYQVADATAFASAKASIVPVRLRFPYASSST